MLTISAVASLVALAGGLFAAGLVSFELISYHLSNSKIASNHWIPVLLAISTAFGVLATHRWRHSCRPRLFF
ncbi:hypothetical protein QA635_08540 [Bradyrhizobium brasilense]|uniref:hypothetical protein n=1 Tax=Bradyrhizobium brasilense TaxID=1419277 RepID=UPI0024B25026|nr:hypothetical protein [Bradyrhizobium australafricanum]WFU34446.1 hypothetical protein QA635_08540 [Bradyrhizobium australafricanum]